MHWTLRYVMHVLNTTGKKPSQLAAIARLSSTTLTRPLRDPVNAAPFTAKTIEKIQAVTGLSPAPFLSGDDASASSDTIYVRAPTAYAEIPRYDAKLAAGAGAWNLEDQTLVDLIPFTWDFMNKYIRRTKTDGLLMLTVSGDSMAPTISDNDLVMVDTAETQLNAGVFALV